MPIISFQPDSHLLYPTNPRHGLCKLRLPLCPDAGMATEPENRSTIRLRTPDFCTFRTGSILVWKGLSPALKSFIYYYLGAYRYRHRCCYHIMASCRPSRRLESGNCAEEVPEFPAAGARYLPSRGSGFRIGELDSYLSITEHGDRREMTRRTCNVQIAIPRQRQ